MKETGSVSETLADKNHLMWMSAWEDSTELKPMF